MSSQISEADNGIYQREETEIDENTKQEEKYSPPHPSETRSSLEGS
jgi:hypothetical protein